MLNWVRTFEGVKMWKARQLWTLYSRWVGNESKEKLEEVGNVEQDVNDNVVHMAAITVVDDNELLVELIVAAARRISHSDQTLHQP